MTVEWVTVLRSCNQCGRLLPLSQFDRMACAATDRSSMVQPRVERTSEPSEKGSDVLPPP